MCIWDQIAAKISKIHLKSQMRFCFSFIFIHLIFFLSFLLKFYPNQPVQVYLHSAFNNTHCFRSFTEDSCLNVTTRKCWVIGQRWVCHALKFYSNPSIKIYLYSAINNRHCFKEALQKIVVWMLKPGSFQLSVRDECVPVMH